MPDLPHTVNAIVKDIAGEIVVLVTENGQEIQWPRELLKSADPGEKVQLLAIIEDDTIEHRQELARHVLNEMLGGN